MLAHRTYKPEEPDPIMDITLDTQIADIATASPATIKVFQQHQIDFCCGGRVPLAEACAGQGVDPQVLLADLRAAQAGTDDAIDWTNARLADLTAHIQSRYHVRLREELPRLGAMLAKVVSRHGDRHSDVLLPLQQTFAAFQDELVEHMGKEDAVLFPAIVEAERAGGRARAFGWVEGPIEVMIADHAAAGAALATMRQLTRGYAPPEDGCPTYRGLYFGLAELERDMHVHVHLENNILFPRVAQLVS